MSPTDGRRVPPRRSAGSAWRIAVVALAVLTVTSACRESPPASAPQSLYGPWKFRPGDDLRWADPAADDRDWSEVQVPKSWGRQGFDDVYGFAWYRLRVALPWDDSHPIGLALGKIDSAYEVFVGGEKLGGVGRLPPDPYMEYDRHAIYVVPPAAREADGSVVIALRIWRAAGKSAGAAGPVEGPFEIGPLGPLLEHDKVAETSQLALVFLLAGAAAFHLGLWLLRRDTPEYGWFGLMAFGAGIYAFLRTQWKYILFSDFVVLKKTEHLMVYAVPVVFLQFLWVFFGRPIPRAVRLLQAVMIAAGLAMLAMPGLDLALRLLPWAQVAAFGAVAAGTLFVVPLLRAGDPEARLLGIGALCVALTIGSDFFIERNLYVAPRTVVYGFAVLVSGMSLALANRFHRVLAEADLLRRDLEQRVDGRTRELSEAYSQMEALALRDGLTGLLNRRALQDVARADLSRARRRKVPFALAMIDVDHFKAINDTHGHVIGDQVLRHIASVLTGAVRASEGVGRWGGEEFMMLLESADPREAEIAAGRVREQIEKTPCPVEDRTIPATVSIGVAFVPAARVEAVGLDDVIRAADTALYQAKAGGRNRVVGATCA